MKRLGLVVALLLCAGMARAELPADWQYFQQVEVTQPGLVKLSLPLDTLNAGRPGLEDLRLLDPAGREVPYLLERPGRAEKVVRRAKKFELSLTPQATIINLETGLAQELEGIILETTAPRFIKAVQIEGSTNKRDWQIIATGQPVFRQPHGATELHLKLPPAIWPFLRLTLDDSKTEPVTFTAALIQAAARPAPTEPLPVTISERQEDERQTCLTLDLGAAHLFLDSVQFETSEPLFMRRLLAAVGALDLNEISAQRVAYGSIYRVAVPGARESANLTLPINRQINSRELRLLIDNQDNQPLTITKVLAQRRPVYVTFFCPQPGVYRVLSGNPKCPAPRYDLAGLASGLQETAVSTLTLTALAPNPSYQPGEPLPEIQDLGTDLDLADFQFRKPVRIDKAGVVRLDLDVETRAGADDLLRDLRLVREGKQRPYLLERGTWTGKLPVEMQPAPDPKKPNLSRWRLKLPYARLPSVALTCTTAAPLFQREVYLYEERTNQRGEKYRLQIGQASWVRRSADANRTLTINLGQFLRTDVLVLEMDNGDNPPLKLENFQISYQITRLWFKAPATPATYLYYGNKNLEAPRYDLELIAPQLLAAEKTAAFLGPQERLQKAGWGELVDMSRTGSVLFWGALGVVVLVLLIVMARLLPKSPGSH